MLNWSLCVVSSFENSRYVSGWKWTFPLQEGSGRKFPLFFYPVELRKDTEDVSETTNFNLMKQEELKMNPKTWRCEQVNGIVASSSNLVFNSRCMDFF